jgi:hypothetical protein
MAVPVKVVNSVLPDVEFKDFIEQVEQSDLTFTQQYPKRLFSSKNHQEWLEHTFSSFIYSIAKPYCNARSIQQIFLTHELPGMLFSIHRAHPAIAGVAVISLDDFPGITLNCLTNSLDNPEDYLWGQGEYQSEDFVFEKNSAIIIKNSDPRHHWGFSGEIGLGRVKRSVWIYFGKE